MLFVNRTCLSVGVGRIIVIVQNLYFIPSHQENTTVAASLAFSFYHIRSAPFDMELYVAKTLFGSDITCAGL
jgi:hypothetical protein